MHENNQQVSGYIDMVLEFGGMIRYDFGVLDKFGLTELFDTLEPVTPKLKKLLDNNPNVQEVYDDTPRGVYLGVSNQSLVGTLSIF
jgi:hypothetical protein